MQLEQCAPSIPTVIAGEDKFLDIRLINQTSKNPVDLSAASEIEAILLNADNTYLEKKLSTGGITLISGPGGNFQINLAASETALLALSPSDSASDIEIHFTIGGKLSIVILTASVNILSRRYPSAP